MNLLEKSQASPLVNENGTLYVAGSRVSFQSIVYHYELGASVEQLAQKFPVLKLADIYSAIAYYLNHRDAVKDYLRQREALDDEAQEKIESEPQYQKTTAELRARLMTRKLQSNQP
jgi:uncharacterized protein (DUF433 family)